MHFVNCKPSPLLHLRDVLTLDHTVPARRYSYAVLYRVLLQTYVHMYKHFFEIGGLFWSVIYPYHLYVEGMPLSLLYVVCFNAPEGCPSLYWLCGLIRKGESSCGCCFLAMRGKDALLLLLLLLLHAWKGCLLVVVVVACAKGMPLVVVVVCLHGKGVFLLLLLHAWKGCPLVVVVVARR